MKITEYRTMKKYKRLNDTDIRKALHNMYGNKPVPGFSEDMMERVMLRLHKNNGKETIYLHMTRMAGYGIAASIAVVLGIWLYAGYGPINNMEPVAEVSGQIVPETETHNTLPSRQTAIQAEPEEKKNSLNAPPIGKRTGKTATRTTKSPDFNANIPASENIPQEENILPPEEDYTQETRDMLCERFDRSKQQIAALRAELEL